MNRKPPLPDHYHNPIPGTCRWCNKPITKVLKNGKPSKSTWHDSCVNEYKAIHWPKVTRRLVWRRDKGKCATCGHQCDKRGPDGWDLDHRIPIYMAEGQIWVWELGNLQTLCKPCHKIKTASEAKHRAEMRKKNK